MGADQLPEILLTAFETAKRRLTCLTGLPLQVIEHSPSVIAGLHTGTEKAAVVLGQSLGLGG
ncbi:hypothetical protein D3C78_1947730 [compost metagenome]